MGQQSDDESSDSSNEFLVPADKLDLNSSFFNEPAIKKIKSGKIRVIQSSSEDSDSDYDYSNENNVSSTELLSQVLKNLENAKNQVSKTESDQSEASTSKTADRTSLFKGDDLSKEINDLLMQGESASTLANVDSQDENKDEDSKEEDTSEYAIPQKGVQIHLPGENFMFDRKKKKQQDLQKMLQSQINSRIRSSQVFIHKVGLLCWLSHGFYINQLSNEPELLAIALSLVSSNNYPKGRPDLKYIEKFTKWFTGQFKVMDSHKEVVFNKKLLLERFSDKKIYNYVELVLLYVATVRGMGINCRLIISLRAPPLKPSPDQLFKIPTNEESNSKSNKIKDEQDSKKLIKQKNNTKSKSKAQPVSPTKIIPKNSREAAKTASEEAKKKAAAVLKGKLASPNKKIENLKKNRKDNNENEEEKDIVDESNMTIAKKLRLRADKNAKSDSKTNSKGEKSPMKRKHDESSLDEEFSNDESDFSSDEEYVEKKPKKRIKQTNQTQANKSNQASESNKHRKLLSSDDDDQKTIKNVFNTWIEVYVESEESWICIDVLNQKIHCVSDLFKKAGSPVLYVVAWNSAGRIKDVTRRYCPHWLTDTRKKRVDEKWWSETLSEWKEKKTSVSRAEDEQLLQRELEQPLPKTITECKGHPLYVLTRHLLKFEALYPPDAVPLGHLKTGEAIYSRHCVHTLMSRETWVKKARVVKPAQEPYKIVKSMPKYDKLSGMKIRNQPLEIFGKWQTQPYEPPVAKDGKVPRNEYGNVDLFKMCMLPIGCVYINLPALNRVARKLNIDCAPACVGFNFGCRGALPAFEGFVVCSEYEDTLREAWETEQIEAQKRAKERREKRIYGNWKKLIKGLLIREKLAAKYNFGDEDDVDEIDKKKEAKIVTKKVIISKKATAKKVVKQIHRNILREESSDDNEEDSECEKPTRSKKISTKTTIDEVSESVEKSAPVKPMNVEKKSIFKKINAAAITAKKTAKKDDEKNQVHSEKMKSDTVSEEVIVNKVASRAKETNETTSTESTSSVVPEKKSIFKKINAATVLAKKAAEKKEEKQVCIEKTEDDIVLEKKTTIAKKLKAIAVESATKTTRKREDKNVDPDCKEKVSTAENKKVRPKKTEASKKVPAIVKKIINQEDSTDEDEDLKEFVTKNKNVVPKKVKVAATKVATRSSKRNKQESEIAAKKLRR